MWKTGFRILILCILFSTLSLEANAKKSVALVIGNSNYKHTGLLKNPANDARDVSASLKRLGFDVMTGIDLTSADFAKLLVDFTKLLKDADVGLLYYAGHGLQFRGENYLVPVDAKLENEFMIKREAFSALDIIEQMEAQARVNMVFLDACRNNPLADELRKNLRTRGRSASVGRGLSLIPSSEGETLLVYAAAPGTQAEDGKGRNSPFTRAFLAHMETPNIEVEVMLKRVTKDVRKETKERQRPERLSRLTIEFYFSEEKVSFSIGRENANESQARQSGDSTLASSEAAEAWTVIRDTKDRGVLHAFVERYGETFYGTLAKNKLKKLKNKRLVTGALPGLKIAGTYTARGANPDGSKYSGHVVIWKEGELYRVKWRVANKTYRGKGALQQDVLTIDWGDTHPVIYTVGADGVLRGTWANGKGKEDLFLKK